MMNELKHANNDCFNFFTSLKFNSPSLFVSEITWTFHNFWCN